MIFNDFLGEIRHGYSPNMAVDFKQVTGCIVKNWLKDQPTFNCVLHDCLPVKLNTCLDVCK